MKLRDVFLGKPIHWLPWPLLAVLFVWMNRLHLHVTWFNAFALCLLAMAAALVAFVLLTTRPGDEVTREPIPPEPGGRGDG